MNILHEEPTPNGDCAVIGVLAASQQTEGSDLESPDTSRTASFAAKQIGNFCDEDSGGNLMTMNISEVERNDNEDGKIAMEVNTNRSLDSGVEVNTNRSLDSGVEVNRNRSLDSGVEDILGVETEDEKLKRVGVENDCFSGSNTINSDRNKEDGEKQIVEDFAVEFEGERLCREKVVVEENQDTQVVIEVTEEITRNESLDSGVQEMLGVEVEERTVTAEVTDVPGDGKSIFTQTQTFDCQGENDLVENLGAETEEDKIIEALAENNDYLKKSVIALVDGIYDGEPIVHEIETLQDDKDEEELEINSSVASAEEDFMNTVVETDNCSTEVESEDTKINNKENITLKVSEIFNDNTIEGDLEETVVESLLKIDKEKKRIESEKCEALKWFCDVRDFIINC